MICTECDFTENSWFNMKKHYRQKHPDVHPHAYFTKEAKSK